MRQSLLDSIACAATTNACSNTRLIVFDGVAFERLLVQLSSALKDGAGLGFADRAQGAARQLVMDLGQDRCTFAEFVAGDQLNVVSSVGTGALAALPRGRNSYPFRWLHNELRSARMVCLTHLPEQLPPEAVEEAEDCRRTGLRSQLSIPLQIGGRLSAILSLESVGLPCSWEPATLARLRIVGEILCNMVAFARSEEEVRQLRGRVWRADRVQHVNALAAVIAHELNQPLSAILSNAQAGLQYLANDGAATGAVKEALEAVVRENKRAVATMRSVRAMVRPEEPQRDWVDLAASLGDVQRLLKSECQAHGIRVETCFDDDCRIMANAVQMGQVGLNLLLNATAALQESPVARRLVRLSVTRLDEDRVRMSVSDSGRGIAAQDVESVFEPFWTTKHDGLGLGLSICRAIVEAHGGRIWAESNAEGGTTFSVELPSAPGEVLAQGGWPGARTLATATARHRTSRQAPHEPLVCVIGDDAACREGVLRLLDGAGWAAIGYESGDAFLADPDVGEVACILLDVRMPDLSGPRFQQQLIEHGCASSIIFTTRHDDVAAGVKAMKMGAVDYLRKPVDVDVLLDAVHRAVAHYAASRARVLVQEASKQRIGRLTLREREVMTHVIRGRLNKQIAADLLIAEQTVKQHRGRVMEKMGVHSVAALVRACEAADLGMEASPRR